jgi:hypothetical protein
MADLGACPSSRPAMRPKAPPPHTHPPPPASHLQEEVGPFTYIKARDKLDVVWDSEGRVSFKVGAAGRWGGAGGAGGGGVGGGGAGSALTPPGPTAVRGRRWSPGEPPATSSTAGACEGCRAARSTHPARPPPLPALAGVRLQRPGAGGDGRGPCGPHRNPQPAPAGRGDQAARRHVAPHPELGRPAGGPHCGVRAAAAACRLPQRACKALCGELRCMRLSLMGRAQCEPGAMRRGIMPARSWMRGAGPAGGRWVRAGRAQVAHEGGSLGADGPGCCPVLAGAGGTTTACRGCTPSGRRRSLSGATRWAGGARLGGGQPGGPACVAARCSSTAAACRASTPAACLAH